nr:zinc finger protein ZAT4-like [Ipomoea batatas]
MACIDQDGQQSASFKHYCRVCKKGFMCGRALGGHMRAHGIGDDSATMEDEDQASDWDEKMNDNNGGERTSFKRMYQLRANPNRLKSVRVCENCGKEFFSWKSFLEHGKCSSDDAESLVSDDGDEDFGRKGAGWSKRKRSFRAAKLGNFASNSSEDEDIILAKCLIDLANARVEAAAEQEAESSAAAAAVFLAPLAAATRPRVDYKAKGTASSSSKGLFECKACKKVFTSHQALGGHRASHKKVKGCYAAKQDQIDNVIGGGDDDVTAHDDFFPPSKTSSYLHQFEPSRRKSKDHECSICHRVFSTGQALGGHKRCHWITSAANSNSNNSYSPETSTPKFHFHHQEQPKSLDLNLPAGDDITAGGIIRRDPRNPFSFEVSTDIHLRPFSMDNDRNHPYPPNDNNIIIDEHQKIAAANVDDVYEDDEADSNNKVELAKLSGMKEMSSINKGNASPWLQVGIGSTAEVGADS